jgi:hypothetical protein
MAMHRQPGDAAQPTMTNRVLQPQAQKIEAALGAMTATP